MPRKRIGLLFQIFRTSHISARLVGKALAPTGIRGDDYAVLSFLFQGPTTLTELAHGTGMPLTTAAGYVRKFEESEYLIRTPNPADARSQIITLTDKAVALVRTTAATFAQTVRSLDEVMAREGVDSVELLDQLELVQHLVLKTLEELPPESN